ncbi:MAG: hypothetical protein ABIS67_09585, partial [Candidatus Eisenbacteria bacterium]
MKKLLISVSLLALIAAPAFAYVQGGQLLDNESAKDKRTTNGTVKMSRWMDGTAATTAPSDPSIEPVYTPLGEDVTRPI